MVSKIDKSVGRRRGRGEGGEEAGENISG